MNLGTITRLSLILFSVPILLWSGDLHAHHVPKELEKHIRELTQKSELIVEAKVIRSESFWNYDRTLIYTGHLTEVKTLVKGEEVPKYVEILTLGGQVGENALTVTTPAKLSKGWTGVLFLKKANVNGSRTILRHTSMDHSYGILDQAKYYYDKVNPPSVLAGNVVKEIDHVLLETIERLAKTERTVYDTGFNRPKAPLHQVARDLIESIDLAPTNPENAAQSGATIEYLIENPQITGTWPKYFEFDVSAKCNVPGTDFAKGEIWVNYNIDAFGPSIVGSGYLTWTEESLVATGDYTVFAEDVAVDKVKLKVDHTGQLGLADLNELPVIEEAMLHLKVRINDLTELANIIFDQDSMTDQSKYRGDGLHPYDVVIAVDPQIPMVGGLGDQGLFLSMHNEDVVEIAGEHWFEADVHARCSYDSTLFIRSHIFMEFNTGCFANLANGQGNYEFIKAGLSDIPNTELLNLLSNAPMGLLGIHIGDTIYGQQGPGVGNPPADGLYIKPYDQLLFKFRIKIENCNQLPEIAFDEWNMVTNSTYRPISALNQIVAYDPIEFPDSFNVLVCPDSIPVIYSFTPKSVSAGTHDTLTVVGANLGDSAAVWFRSAENLTNAIYFETRQPHYGLRSDSMIKVAVPSLAINDTSAGTGRFFVKTAQGDTTWSDANDPLEVRFSALNFRDSFPNDHIVRRTLLINQDSILNPPGYGGYYFNPNSALAADQDALTCAEAALAYWRCVTNVHFNLDVNSTSDVYANDNINTIALVDSATLYSLPIQVGAGSLAFAWLKAVGCTEADSITLEEEYLFYIEDIDILINEQHNWHTDTSTTPTGGAFDLYSTLLHEVGHGVMLEHTLNPGDVMLPSLAPDTTRRVISPFDLEGGNYCVNLSTVDHWFPYVSCPSFMVPDSTDYTGATFDIQEEPTNTSGWNVWPNPNNGDFRIDHDCDHPIDNVFLIDPVGRSFQLISDPNSKIGQRVITVDAPSGLYVLHYNCHEHSGASIVSIINSGR